jgi:hypothetical protein
VLKLFFNPNPLIYALNIQSRVNDLAASRHHLYYELIHNLVVETTRLGIEVKNLKMRVESLDARIDFNERRARALEGAVIYRSQTDEPIQTGRPAQVGPEHAPRQVRASGAAGGSSSPTSGQPPIPEGAGQRSRRRRRRRGRRGGAPAAATMGQSDTSSRSPQTIEAAPATGADSTGNVVSDAQNPLEQTGTTADPGQSPADSGQNGSDDQR